MVYSSTVFLIQCQYVLLKKSDFIPLLRSPFLLNRSVLQIKNSPLLFLWFLIRVALKIKLFSPSKMEGYPNYRKINLTKWTDRLSDFICNSSMEFVILISLNQWGIFHSLGYQALWDHWSPSHLNFQNPTSFHVFHVYLFL